MPSLTLSTNDEKVQCLRNLGINQCSCFSNSLTVAVWSLSYLSWCAAHYASLSFISPRVCSKSCPLSLWCYHLIFSHLFHFLPSVFPSIRVYSNDLALRIRWPKYWNVTFSIIPSDENSGLISFSIDWFDLLTVQGTFKSLPQHLNPKASILRYSASLMLQLSHPYMTPGMA